MMKTMLIFLFSISITAGYYTDHPVVQELTESGEYVLELNSKSCPKRYGPKKLVDLLGKKLCIQKLDTPLEVATEVDLMKLSELDNESDYDQRVTELLSFKWKSYMSAAVSMSELKELLTGLSISHDLLKDVNFESIQVDRSTFSQFEGLYLGNNYVDKTHTSEFINNEFFGSNVQVIKMTKESELYPGGGFNVTHTLIFSDTKVMYIKLSWWNS